MVTGPSGEVGPAVEAGGTAPLDGDDGVFVNALESIIDRALKRHPRGERFVYGIHQEIDPAVAEVIERRYREVGWSKVTVRPGATGAYLVVLTP